MHGKRVLFSISPTWELRFWEGAQLLDWSGYHWLAIRKHVVGQCQSRAQQSANQILKAAIMKIVTGHLQRLSFNEILKLHQALC